MRFIFIIINFSFCVLFPRYLVLKAAGVAQIERAFRTDVPVGLFGEILEALATFPPTTRDVVAVARILEALASTKRLSFYSFDIAVLCY